MAGGQHVHGVRTVRRVCHFHGGGEFGWLSPMATTGWQSQDDGDKLALRPILSAYWPPVKTALLQQSIVLILAR